MPSKSEETPNNLREPLAVRPRTIKVSTLWRITNRVRRGRESRVPFIRISGNWLATLGFTAETRVIIRGEPGQLTMTILTPKNSA